MIFIMAILWPVGVVGDNFRDTWVGDEVEVLSMAPEDVCQHEMFVMTRWDRAEGLVVPLSQLEVIYTDSEETQEAVEDWIYWVGRGYKF